MTLSLQHRKLNWWKMGLQTWEWAVRVGIPPNLLERSNNPEKAVAYISALLLWRWDEIMSGVKRAKWDQDVVSSMISGRNYEKAFYRELLGKKSGLYGFTVEGAADPSALVRHPWALKKHEFEDALAKLEDGKVPDVPDDRAHVSSLLEHAGEVGGGLAGGLMLTPLAPIAPFVGGAAATSAALGGTIAEATDQLATVNNDRFLRKLPEYRAVYRQEQDFRRREVTS